VLRRTAASLLCHDSGRRARIENKNGKLDPEKFLRIYRSRIVRGACVLELRSIGNREHVVKLSDSSEHRSSRIYAGNLEK
jgi:hypothetical protein